MKKDILIRKMEHCESMNDDECEWLTYYESLKSRGDNEHKKHEDPLVGALVRNDKNIVIGLTHRGCSFEGNHAEYELLKNKLAGKDLTGCELFTTLEPCIDEVRSKKGGSCSSIIASTPIKKVHIGVLDPNINVGSKGISFLFSKGITVIPYKTTVKDKINDSLRKFSTNINSNVAIKKRIQEKVLSRFQKGSLEVYLKDVANKKQIPFDFDRSKDEFISMLIDKGYVSFDAKNVKVEEQIKIMFYDAKYLTTTSRMIKIINSDIDSKSTPINDSIPIMFHKMFEYYKNSKFILLTMEDFREAISNAIIHKDYDINSPGITIEKEKGQIKISNVASKNISQHILDMLKIFNPPLYSPGNGIITELSNNAGYSESSLKGVRTFKNAKNKPKFVISYRTITIYFKW